MPQVPASRYFNRPHSFLPRSMLHIPDNGLLVEFPIRGNRLSGLDRRSRSSISDHPIVFFLGLCLKSLPDLIPDNLHDVNWIIVSDDSLRWLRPLRSIPVSLCFLSLFSRGFSRAYRRWHISSPPHRCRPACCLLPCSAGICALIAFNLAPPRSGRHLRCWLYPLPSLGKEVCENVRHSGCGLRGWFGKHGLSHCLRRFPAGYSELVSRSSALAHR